MYWISFCILLIIHLTWGGLYDHHHLEKKRIPSIFGTNNPEKTEVAAPSKATSYAPESFDLAMASKKIGGSWCGKSLGKMNGWNLKVVTCLKRNIMFQFGFQPLFFRGLVSRTEFLSPRNVHIRCHPVVLSLGIGMGTDAVNWFWINRLLVLEMLGRKIDIDHAATSRLLVTSTTTCTTF